MENEQKIKSIAYATFWQRILAFIIDLLLMVAVYYILLGIIETLGFGKRSDYIFITKLNAYCLYGWLFLYYPIADKFGGTLGKKLIKIQCVDSDSFGQISYIQAYVRVIVAYGIWIASFLFSAKLIPVTSSITVVFYLPIFVSGLNIISILFSQKNQGWCDKVARVIVVKNK